MKVRSYIMTNEQIIMKIAELVVLLINQNKSEAKKVDTDSIEMLTVTEAIEEFPGLTRSTLRQLIAQNKIRYFRAGEGNNGKILINKANLIAYLKQLCFGSSFENRVAYKYLFK